MRHTCHLFAGSVLDAPSLELRRTARRVAHAETRRLREKKAVTNPYHKEQYISAFLEAHSTALVHRHVVSTSASAKHIEKTPATALSAAQELTTLAQELDARYATHGSPARLARSSAEALSADNTTRLSISSLPHTPGIMFGAWRSTNGGDTRLRQRLRSADVMRHCVIRESRTPPSLSPEVIERMLPPRLPAPAQRLMVYLKSERFQRIPGPETCDRLESLLSAALRALHYSHELQRAVALYAVLCLSTFRDWHMASAIVVSLVHRWSTLVALSGMSSSELMKAVHEDRSHIIALFLETVRFSSLRPSFTAPSLDELDKVCVELHKPFEEVDTSAIACFTHAGGSLDDNGTKRNGTAAAFSPRWNPVVSAPLLSVMGLHRLNDSRFSGSETAKMKSLAERFCLHRSRPSPSPSAPALASGPAYMPALAWGEYLRALHRCGASLAEMQEATDRITDKACTRHADSLLTSTHVWNAYLACSPGSHAKEVYEKNLRAYKVRETPATTAAVMIALLREGTAESRAEARTLWKRLQHVHVSGKMVPHTSSTLTAYIRLLEAEGQADALLGLLTSFEGLYEPFGVAPESFSRAVKAVHQRGRGGSRTARGLDLLAHVCHAHPFLVPPLVRYTMVQAIEQTTTAAASAKVAVTGHNGRVEASLPIACPFAAAALEFSAENLAATL
ncbi:conserved hypothetical protein [Leishmania major strain Friedlin]|uniref:Uncharacterized protein n=1 Tax=Leishmania major TaxID=5664 RepID=Q4Q6M6_LEIMA|nr:conserved hypothetical protein [Leishmania major strain Friedlin]CAG9579188.1 hypothetical_protein_-_conserved [Leishmania major strain Friedlin]CAJ08224.1 conserved hypothetical protein [Leishmania major strain Friedlin]|eukprot:XP_001685022.1 conserved hypothetical protein [Leishmania major strain Friedlin]